MPDEVTMTPRGLMRSIIAQVAREQHIDPVIIEEGSSRLKDVRLARVTVASRLFVRGMSPDRIGRLMKRRRATILNYIRSVEEGDDQQDGTEGSGAAGEARGAG